MNRLVVLALALFAPSLTSIADTSVAGVIAGTAGPDELWGTSGNDTINGKRGADRMTGYSGNDTYIVDDEADVVVEQSGEGVDTVRVFGSYLLPDHVENLVIAGSQDGFGMGNHLVNRLTGNAAYNTLDGGTGNDVLTGRGGPDLFRFTTKLNATLNVDRITDFEVAEDAIALHYTAFPAFTTSMDGGFLAPSKFHVGAAATTSSHRIVYDPRNGRLYYDGDGSGPMTAVRFAILAPNLALTAHHFLVWSRYQL